MSLSSKIDFESLIEFSLFRSREFSESASCLGSLI